MSACGHSLSLNRGRGTSLIEVLIALTLVAVTMLGLLGLQLRSMGMQKDSIDRRAAAMIVAGFGDRVAANYAGYEAVGVNYTNLTTAQPLSGPTASVACTTPSSCTTQEIVLRDWALLQSEVGQRLPGGMVFTLPPRDALGVALNAGIQVTVAWTDVQRTQANQPGATLIGTDPACSDAFHGVVPAAIAADTTYRCYSAYVYP